ADTAAANKPAAAQPRPTQSDDAKPTDDAVAGLLTIPEDVPADQRASQIMSEASMNLATARGTMSTYASLIEQHGSAEIRQQFAPVKNAYDESMKTANAMMFKLAASDDQTLPKLVARFNDNWKKVQQALATSRQLQLKALSSQPVSGSS
ncbi:MAG: hypothetical protein WBW92_11830, partial [Rhodanobacteraceae bacterium]